MTKLDRRTFIKTAAVGTAGIAWAGSYETATAAEPKRRFTMDLTPGMIGVRADQSEAIRLAHQYGFESVAPSAGFLAKLSDDELQELLADLTAKNLVWGAAGLSVDFRGDDERFKASMQQFPATAKGLERAGVTRVCTWLSPSSRSLTYMQNFRQHATRLREVAKVMADHGLRLGLEYVGPKTSWTATQHPFIHTMAETKDLIAEIDRDNVGFLLDAWHWHNAREGEAELLSLSNQDVVGCHLNDAPADVPIDELIDSRRGLPMSTGVIDAKTFLGALVKIGYDGPVCAEPFDKTLNAMDNEPAMAATAAAMKKAIALVD